MVTITLSAVPPYDPYGPHELHDPHELEARVVMCMRDRTRRDDERVGMTR